MAIELRSPSAVFIEQAKEWHTNEELNHWTGFGRGNAGKKLAHMALEAFRNDEAPDSLRMLAAWDGPTPIGYVVFSDIDGKNKTADLHLTIGPENQGNGYGTKVLTKAVSRGFNGGLYRMTFRPLSSNRGAIAVARKVGFELEAYTKYSVWTQNGPQTQAQMRVIKPEWRPRKTNRDS